MKEKNTVAKASVFVALALLLSYLESLVPIFYGVPGVKIGIANIVILFALYDLGAKSAFLISIVRVGISSILFGNVMVAAFSFAGAIASYVVMVLLKRSKQFGVLGVGVAGAVTHNLAQCVVAVFVLDNSAILYYLPVLVVTGVFFGICIGFLASIVCRRLRASGC